MMKAFRQKRDQQQQSGLPARPATRGEKVAMLASFLVPFLAGFNFIMNHFYVRAGYLVDAGWFAALMWHPQEFTIANPAVISDALFYSTHLSPVLYGIGLLSFMWPYGPVTWFAIFQGLVPGGGGLLACLALRKFPFLKEKPALVTVLAIACALNGLSMIILSYPHIEALGTLMACACLAAFFSGRRLLAILFLLLSVSVREDMGFHIVAPAGLLWLWTMWKARRLTAGKDILTLVLPAFALSLAAVLIRSAFFPADDAFTRIYTGTPPYAHLTWALMQERFTILFTQRLYVVLPAAVALAAAVVWRNPVPFIGFVAYLPWLALNITAVSSDAGTLEIYYPFPFQIAIFWFLWFSATSPEPFRSGPDHGNGPAPRHDAFAEADAPANAKNRAGGPQGSHLFIPAFVIAGLVIAFPWKDLLSTWDSRVVMATDAAVAGIAANRDVFGRMKIDQALLSLAPRAFLWEDHLDNPDTMPPETLIWHARSLKMAEVRKRIHTFPASALYSIAGTPFYIASHIGREQIERTGLKLRPVMGNNILPLMRTRYGQIGNSIHDLPDNPSGHKIYGPGLPLPPGRYRVDIDARIFDPSAGEAVADVYNTATETAVSTPLARGEGGATATTGMEFTVGAENGNWEFRIAGERLRGIRIVGVYLRSLDEEP